MISHAEWKLFPSFTGPAERIGSRVGKRSQVLDFDIFTTIPPNRDTRKQTLRSRPVVCFMSRRYFYS